MSDNLFEQVAVLIETLTESLTKSTDRLETNQADLYKKIHDLTSKVSTLDTQAKLLDTLLLTLKEQLERAETTQEQTHTYTKEQLDGIHDLIKVLNEFMNRTKHFKEFEKGKADKAYKDKIMSILLKLAQYGAAGAAGGGIIQALNTMMEST